MIARPFPTRFQAVLGLLLVLLFSCQRAAAAGSIMATGDPSNLWIIKPAATGDTFTILHRRTADQPESRLNTGPSIRGKLINNGAVAGDGHLWLFYQDSTVQSIRVLEDAIGRRGYTDIILPSLPKGITIRSAAVTRSGGWVLARIEDQRLLDAIDHPQIDERTLRERRRDAKEATMKLKDETGGDASKDSPKDSPKATEDAAIESPEKPGEKATVAPAPAVSIKADRLLHLARDRWESVALPADWNVELPATLVTPSFEDARPLLVVTRPAEQPTHRMVRWYSWEKPRVSPSSSQPADDAGAATLEAWVASEQTVEKSGSLTATTIDRQLVVLDRLNSPGKIEWSVTSVRTERVSDLGTLSLEDRSGPWALAAVGDQLGLITADDKGELQLMRINLRGVTDANPVPLAATPPSLGPVADLLVFVIVLALVTPVLILMWKRDPAGQPLALPRGIRVADLLPRGLAAMIDLFPCLYIASLITGVSIDRMVDFWPGKSGGWEPMIPGAIGIGLFIASTFLTELFTARTMGKAMLGLRVTGLQGQPPDLWQVLARNLFKALDLIAMPLLIFAIISPNRQRLGDVVGRTVVVTPASPEEGDGRPGQRKRTEEEESEKDGSEPPPDPRPKRPK